MQKTYLASVRNYYKRKDLGHFKLWTNYCHLFVIFAGCGWIHNGIETHWGLSPWLCVIHTWGITLHVNTQVHGQRETIMWCADECSQSAYWVKWPLICYCMCLQRDMSEIRSTTLTHFVLNWTLSELAGLYQPHTVLAHKRKEFDVTNVEDWYQQVVMPLLRSFLPNHKDLMHQNITLAFHQVL